MEIAAPSIQRQQMADLEKSSEAANQVTAIQTRTTNIAGDEIQVVTTTQYEQQVFSSKTDWRIRAISATNIPLRLQHVYVTNDDVKEDLPTFVLAKNIMKSFVCSADLRTPVCGYLFGTVATDNSRVVEVKAVAMVPQRASQRSVELVNDLPTHPLLADLKIVGIICVRPAIAPSVTDAAQTQAQETQSLTPTDAVLYAKLMAMHSEIDGDSIMLTVAFTPGSLSLSAYVLTPKGFEWGRNADANAPAGYNPASMVDRAQLLLSDRILGSTFGTSSLRCWAVADSCSPHGRRLELLCRTRSAVLHVDAVLDDARGSAHLVLGLCPPPWPLFGVPHVRSERRARGGW